MSPGLPQAKSLPHNRPFRTSENHPVSRPLVNRILTTVVAAPAAVAIVLALSPEMVFFCALGVFFWAAIEFVKLAQLYAPSAPIGALLILFPVASLLTFRFSSFHPDPAQAGLRLFAAYFLLALVAALCVLLARAEMRDGLPAIGILAFATPYFAAPPLALFHLEMVDPWLVIALLAIVWIGDTAAFFLGSWLGRHKLAPTVSPNKTWEGAAASLLAAVATAAVWSHLRLGQLEPGLLLVAAATSIGAQVGDLVESMVKRGVGAKDSSNVLPGHGGFYDRLDALILAAPVFLMGCWILGFDRLTPTS